MREPSAEEPAAEAPSPQVSRALGEARQTLDEAQRALERGDWAAFGQAMQRLRSTLSQPGSEGEGGAATQDREGKEDVGQ